MARWTLICPRCFHRFEYSKVDADVVEEARRDPFMVVPKPTFKSGGEKKCPACRKDSLFRAFELMYYADALGACG